MLDTEQKHTDTHAYAYPRASSLHRQHGWLPRALPFGGCITSGPLNQSFSEIDCL